MPSAFSFCLPSAVLPLTPSHTRRGLSRPLISLATRARASDRESPAPPATLLPRSRAPSFLFLLFRGRFLSFSIGGSFRASRPHPSLPFPHTLSSCSCSLFLLVRPHRGFSSTVRVRGHEAPLRIISSRLPRLALLRAALLSLLRSLRLLLLPLPSFFLPALLPPLLLPSPPIADSPSSPSLSLSPPLPPSPSPLGLAVSLLARARGINYSKNLYCYYYRLTIPSALKPRRRALESSTMRDSVRALPTTSIRRQARATTATTGRRCLVPLW